MGSLDNLIRTSPEQAREFGRRGGSVSTLSKKLSNRKHCNENCPLWVTCWARHVSIARRELEQRQEGERAAKEAREPAKIKARCALKEMPSRTVQMAVKVSIGGEEGFNQEIMENLLRYASSVELAPNRKDDATLIRLLIDAKKAIFGDRRKIDATVQDNGALTADRFRELWQKVKAEEADKSAGGAPIEQK
jgi:hypothetical protein